MAAIGTTVLILKGNIDGWDVNTNGLLHSRQDRLTQNNINTLKNNPPQVLIINAHGSRDGIEIDTNGCGAWQYIRYEDFFSNFKKDGPPVVVFLFGCYASSACKKEIVELLPKGSMIGFFAPKMDISRKEVSWQIITKIIENYKRYLHWEWTTEGRILHQEILFKMMPCCESHIAYNHPIHGFKYIAFPSYINIARADDVRDRISANLVEYNTFLQEINFQKLPDYAITPSDSWYKDLWFMQMVVELADAYREHKDAAHQKDNQVQAIEYLNTIEQQNDNAQNLLFHQMQFAGKPMANIKGYFEAYNDKVTNSIPGGSIGRITPKYFSTIIPFLSAPKESNQIKFNQSQKIEQQASEQSAGLIL